MAAAGGSCRASGHSRKGGSTRCRATRPSCLPKGTQSAGALPSKHPSSAHAASVKIVSGANDRPPIIRRVIDREQVLQVAKLARLKLSEDEVETMSKELSGILEHVERISELNLEGVEPTSHVVELENVLRPDEPRESWERERVLEPAPDPADGSFRVPSPQA